MKYEMFTIKDIVVGNFGSIVLLPNSAVAERWFDGVCQKDRNVAKDLQLFKLGTYNIETGEIISVTTFVKSGVICDEA